MTSRSTDPRREVEAALAGLTVTAPADAPPGRPRRGRPGRLPTPGSTRRSGRSSWPGTGAACRSWTRQRDDATFEARHARRPGRAAFPVDGAAARGWPRPSGGGSAATGASASTSTCAATARSSRTSGARRSRSPAARSGRTAGSPRRSAGPGGARRGHGPRPQPGAARSCRATGSSAPTARSASTRWAGPDNKRTILRSEGLDPDGLEAQAAAGIRYTGSDTTRIVCLPTCRHARRVDGRASGRLRSVRAAAEAGYRPCKVCRPDSGALSPPEARRASSGAPRRMLCTWTNPPMPTKRPPAPSAARSGSGCWSCTSSGARPTSASPIAVETIPPFLMAAVRFGIAGAVLMGWSLPAHEARSSRRADASGATASIVGALLLGGGMGMVAFGRADHPIGDHGAAGRADAGLGRDLRAGPARRATAAAGRSSASSSASSGWRSSWDRRPWARAARSTPAGLAAVIISPIAWSLGSLYASHRAVLPRQPLVATGAQMLAGGAVLGRDGRRERGVRAVRPGRRLERIARGARLPHGRRQPARVHAYGWLLRVAPLPFIATYAYVNPVVAVILGAVVRNEPIDPRTVVAGGGDHRRRGADRDRARPDDGTRGQVVGRSQPWAGHGSHRSGRSSR